VRPNGEWVDNIKKDITEIRWGGLNCINVAWDRSKWLAIEINVKKFRVAQNTEYLKSPRNCQLLNDIATGNYLLGKVACGFNRMRVIISKYGGFECLSRGD